jgi:hypothetical protein
MYQLQEDYTVKVHQKGKEISITVPKGYITDLASIPRIVWTLSGLTPDGLYRAAALVHDYIYGMHLHGTEYSVLPGSVILTRSECDSIFLELIKDSGESPWKYEAMFYSVRVFGWLFY